MGLRSPRRVRGCISMCENIDPGQGQTGAIPRTFPADLERQAMARAKAIPALCLALLAGLPNAGANSTKLSGKTQPAAESRFDVGRHEFLTFCSACHGVGGEGDGVVAEFLGFKAVDLTKLTAMNAGSFPRQRVTDAIDGRADVKAHGARDMPVWGDWFSYEAKSSGVPSEDRERTVRDRIDALADYIESIQQN
jgi:mono/diheme cytochrome c family protein